ncbi:hypothetical protein [Corynebacterium sp. TAE3-ERU30]|uniref:hypothetical protein n=1 Tax=Corynebacterium sp. TAE3-ERU30 TaxID=2849496 RepID=UPI001C485D8E|nr:hypothetical protein [Corynebacterium sp. TAE3-ERU30]MBV7281660.1 hypothetical protein [Corynebacterium sp. TAE3-ERU30]
MTLTAGTPVRRPRRSAQDGSGQAEHDAYRPSPRWADTSHRSRDYSTSTFSSVDTLERDKDTAERESLSTRYGHRATTLRPQAPAAPKPQRKFQRRLGSQQVVSVRGRRVESPRPDQGVVRTLVFFLLLSVLGVVGTMSLSGLNTEQTFTIQRLSQQDAQLGNQLETLRRDVEQSRAAADAAARAADHKMVIPGQPGALDVRSDGVVEEKLAPNPNGNLPIIDVNKGQGRPNRASSDPNRTEEMRDRLEAVAPRNNSVNDGVAETRETPNSAQSGAPLPYAGR